MDIYPAFPPDQQVVFTYTTNLTLFDAANTSIRYVTLDFQGKDAGVVLSASALNQFDITIRNSSGTALTLTTPPPGPTAGSTVHNRFDRLYIFNVATGITFTADAGGATSSADNYFGDVLIDGVSVVGLQTIRFCDSNYFARLAITGLANRANGVIINNSSTPDTNTDAGGQMFSQLIIDPASPTTYTGTILTMNNSTGTYIGQFGNSAVAGHGIVFALGNSNATYTFGLSEDFTGMIPTGTFETSHLDISGPITGANGLTLDDSRDPKWSIYRGGNDELELDDISSRDAAKHRISLITQANTDVSSKNASAVRLNMGASSGTGGTQFGSGGASPSVVATIDNVGNMTPSGHINQSTTKNFAGSCTMATATTCTFRLSSAVFNGTPLCFVTIDAASTVPAMANSAKCSISGTTVTITAGIANSLTWDALLIGNPN